MRSAVLRHVEEVASASVPYASVWDVINETYDNHDLMDLLGEHILVDIFAQAKKFNPHAVLYINDYNILSNNGLDHGHQDSYEKVIQYLLDQHAPLEGIGMQGHFGQQFTPPTRLLSVLDRYARFRLPIQLTEFSVDGDDAEANARYMHDVMTVLFSHPAVNAFVFWGSISGFDYPASAQADKSMLFDSQGQPTTMGKVWRDLVYKQWWTNEDVVTGPKGDATVQGYHGQYEVTASAAGGKAPASIQAELKPGGTTVKITVSP
jgi:GH35 family endo-1,4-beta-xylanase